MTTIAIARKDNQIAIGVDSRRSSGYGDVYPADVAGKINKVHQIGENYIAHCGSAAWGLVIPSYFASLKEIPSMRKPIEIFQVLTDMHKVLKDRYNLCPSTEAGESAFEGNGMNLVIANPFGIFTVDRRRSVTPIDKYWAEGSGSEYAIGAMFATYDTKATPAEIVEIGLQAGAAFNAQTAPPFNTFTFQQDNHETKKADS